MTNMDLGELLKKSKKLAVVPLLGLALAYSPMDYKKCSTNLDEEQVSISSVKIVEGYSLNYDVGVYFLGIKFFSCDADFYFKKFEENGLVEEVMGASGRYSDNYYGSLLTVVSKDKDYLEKHSYFIKYGQTVFKDEATFYKNKIVFVKDGLERIIANEDYVGLQSVIKPLLTEELSFGQTFNSKTFIEDDFYECKFVVEEKESVKVKGKYVDAYHVVLKTGKPGSKKKEVANLWVVEGKPHNKIVKISFNPFILTEVKVFLDS